MKILVLLSMMTISNFAAAQDRAVSRKLTPSELSVGGVTIGTSNLYNSIGKFGPNTINKDGDAGGAVQYVCYIGDDGTLLAFESGEHGGPDQTITDAFLQAKDTDYRFKAKCKPSKKVNAKLSLFDVHLGDALKDVAKTHGDKDQTGDQKLSYRYTYSVTKKKKVSDYTSVAEIYAVEDHVTQISVGQTVTH